jgi:malonyl-CoA O-methyltransferase
LNDEIGIKRRFGKSAKTYDNYAEIQNQVALTLNSQINSISPKDILEIGCGTGLLSVEIVKKYPAANFTFTDISKSMLETAKQKLHAQFPDKKSQFKFKILNPEKNIGQEKYDLIISSMAIHWFIDILNSLKSIQSALKQTGTFHFSTIGTKCFKEWRETLNSLQFGNGLRIPPELPGIIENETISVSYGSAKDFLKGLKLTGAHSPKPGYTPLSSPQLKLAMKKLEETHNATLSWHIIYGQLTSTTSIK